MVPQRHQGSPASQDNNARQRREATVESAFGGEAFKAKGMAAKTAFIKYTGADGANPEYSDKAKTRAENPGKFSGNKREFNTWVTKLADKFEEDTTTFRNEKSRMRFLLSCLEGTALESVETRYSSQTRPFSCLAEMIQALEAAYYDPNQSSTARS